MQDGREIDAGQDPFLHVTQGGEQLRFLRTLPSHTANYTCKATNEAGEDHVNFHVQVMGKLSFYSRRKTVMSHDNQVVWKESVNIIYME